ncbi:MAG: endonuclease/exonuclease/phosphatase family protein [Rhodobiaceae bacterium]|nr:endonuclease/exonuclease/phosphatase family protein [Rhodobiaceae bacterium]
MIRFSFFHELRGALSLILVGLLLALGLGFASVLFEPFDLFSHFRIPVTAALAVLTVMLLALRARTRAIAAFLATLIGVAGLVVPLFITAAPVRTDVPNFKLVSFNMLFINERPQDVAAMLEREKPDVAFILEAPALYPYLDRLKRLFPYTSGCPSERFCDLLVLSQRPLLDVQRPGARQRWDRIVIAGVDVDGTRLNAVAMHLSKPYMDGSQEMETEWVAKLVAALKGPVILAGDFNATSWSGVFQRFASAAHLMPIAGYRPTWPSEFPTLGFPIDHTLVRDVTPVSIRIMKRSYGSNHLGQVAEFRIGPPSAGDGSGQ